MKHDNESGTVALPRDAEARGRWVPPSIAALLFALGSNLATTETAVAACDEMIDVEVTLGDQCNNWTSWQSIDELESISTLPVTGLGQLCRRGQSHIFHWQDCQRQTQGNQFRSRSCGGASAVATGVPAECQAPPAGGGSDDVANAPLFLTAPVDPNIMFVLDDSGSMQFEHMPDHTFTNYVFPRPGSVYGGTVYDNLVPEFSDSNIHNVFNRSPQNNAVFYNPLITYRPWVDHANNPYPDTDPEDAPYNPADSGVGSMDLTTSRSQSAYWFYNNNNNPGSAYYACTQWPYFCSRTFYPITFYMYKGSGSRHAVSNYVKYQIRGSTGYRRDLDGGSETTVSSFVWQDEEGTEVASRTVAEERQNFANWFTYHRSRILASRAGIGRAFAQQTEGMRVGFGAINVGSRTIDGVSSDYAILKGVRPFTGDDREEFFDTLYDHTINVAGTPLRRALDAAGEYFTRSDNPGPWGEVPGENVATTHLECRQSYTILMTDGFWNGSNPSVGNTDNAAGSSIASPAGETYQYQPTDPYRDDWSNTLADVAMKYWKQDLRPDLANRVPTHPKNEAFWQHVATFGVGLGVTGTVEDSEAWDAVANGDAIAWPYPDPDDSSPAKLDDLLHASVNSRGGFFTAADPDAFASELSDILDAIVSRVDTSANSAASSSAVLQSDTLLYTAGFRSGDWSGTLTARRLNSDGSLEPVDCEACWDAEAELRARSPASRNLFTFNPGEGEGAALDWDLLGSAQQGALNRGVNNSVDGLGPERLDWLAGVEQDGFRGRSETGPLRLLGDFIHSDPQFRNNVLYLGANDGMLHAFDGSTGEELFAYVPGELLLPEPGRDHAPLSRLMDPAYSHRFFMDGTVTVADLTVDGESRTILVGGMGAGGRSFFALDVTDPANFSADDILWEFTDAELGYRAGAPAIVRTRDDGGSGEGTWSVIFGNGYGGDSGEAHLFVVELLTGDLVAKIPTNDATPNGLAAPFVTDWPAADLRASRVYAGDLQGNLWVFDLSSSNSNQWDNAGNRRILFTATDDDGNVQPITSRPYGARLASGEVIVAFGTGSYFRLSDKDDEGIQSLYGIIDPANPGNDPQPVSRADELLEQEIITQVSLDADEGEQPDVVRLVSSHVPDPEVHKGWYLDLDAETGERVISGPRALGRVEQRVRFTTLIPDEDPCGSGRRGFLMDISLATGGRVEVPVFDLSGDFEFNEADLVDFDGDGVSEAPSGIGFGTGESPVVVDVRSSGQPAGPDHQIVCDGQGNCEIGRPSDIITGRQSWQQLR